MKSNTINILLVDDSSSMLNYLIRIVKITCHYLEINNFNIDFYESYTSYTKSNTNKYDLAIIDWNLPDGKGKDIIKDLDNCKYKAIFTGMVDDNIEIGNFCFENFIDYIPKGFDHYINKYISEKLKVLKEF